MKTKIFAAYAGLAIIATGCFSTVTDSKKAGMPMVQDQVPGRYERSLDQVYQAAVQVVQKNGVVLTEFIPHDTTNTVRSLQGKVNQCNVWVLVSAETDPKISSVVVEARTKWGDSNVDLAHELEKDIALQLAQ